jgi:hypothetical protein
MDVLVSRLGQQPGSKSGRLLPGLKQGSSGNGAMIDGP